MSKPSEAAMREAAEVVAVLPPFSQRTLKNDAVATAIFARALDRHAAAERERAAKIAEDMASYCRRTGAWKTLDEAAAAIRSAP